MPRMTRPESCPEVGCHIPANTNGDIKLKLLENKLVPKNLDSFDAISTLADHDQFIYLWDPTNPEHTLKISAKALSGGTYKDGDGIVIDSDDRKISIDDAVVQRKVSVTDRLTFENNLLDVLSEQIKYTAGCEDGFVTNVTVGHLASGTMISPDMTLGEILHMILYKPVPQVFDIYYGGAGSGNDQEDPKPSDLDLLEKHEITNVQDLLGAHVYTLHVATEDDTKFPAFALPNQFRVTKWCDATGSFTYQFNKLTVDENTDMYWIPSEASDYPFGTPYQIIVVEG